MTVTEALDLAGLFISAILPGYGFIFVLQRIRNAVI